MVIDAMTIWYFLFLAFSYGSAYPPASRTWFSKNRLWTSSQLSSINKLEVDFRKDDAAVLSLKNGSWVKFIAGASNQDLPLIRNMCYLYTLAGVNCIDMSADPAVITVAKEGVNKAMIDLNDPLAQPPLIMISVNDDDDPHFRKAVFDPVLCPPECSRPCEKVCPAWAIPPLSTRKIGEGRVSTINQSSDQRDITATGVLADRCYGCGRCVPICPLGLIKTESYTVSTAAINDLFASGAVDAIEIHTLRHHEKSFNELWSNIGDAVLTRATIISISFPNMGEETIPYLESLQSVIVDCKSWNNFKGVQIWQADGRPMSGDIGRGTAHKSSNLAASVLFDLERRLLEEQRVLSSDGNQILIDSECRNSNEQYQANPSEIKNSGSHVPLIDVSCGMHFVQLAGGTNDYSARSAEQEGLLGAVGFGGFAFGGYARKIIGELLHELEDSNPGGKVEDHPIMLGKCLVFARNLVSSVKEVK